MEKLPWKLTGFDIQLRICWRRPFFRCSIGEVWHLPEPTKIKVGGHDATIYEKTSLPPG